MKLHDSSEALLIRTRLSFGPSLFLFYGSEVFDVFSNSVPLLFADSIKIVYTFRPESPGWQNSAHSITAKPLDDGTLRRKKQRQAVYLRHTRKKPNLGNQISSVNFQARYQNLTNSCTLKFPKIALTHVSKADNLLGVLCKNLKLIGSKLNHFRT